MAQKKVTAEEGKKALEEASKVPSVEDLEKDFQEHKGELEAKEDATAAMLERMANQQSAVADPDMGVDVDIDFEFMDEDPHDCKPFLERAGEPHEPDKFHYRWVATSQRQYNKMRTRGYEPVKGIMSGDRVLCRLPLEQKAKLEKRIDHRKRLFSGGESAKFDSEVTRQGGVPFDGPRSRKEGMGPG